MNQHLSQKSKRFRWRKFNGGSSLWNNVEQTKMDKFKESMRGILSFHQKSKYETEGQEEGIVKKKKKKGWSLPWWTIYIAWVSKYHSRKESADWELCQDRNLSEKCAPISETGNQGLVWFVLFNDTWSQ